MSAPLTAAEALDRYFLETRCKIIEVAATLDRIDRGAGVAKTTRDPRLTQLRQAIGVLLEAKPNRAADCQTIFSLPYDERWTPPNKR